jgi:hypothetical protein
MQIQNIERKFGKVMLSILASFRCKMSVLHRARSGAPLLRLRLQGDCFVCTRDVGIVQARASNHPNNIAGVPGRPSGGVCVFASD